MIATVQITQAVKPFAHQSRSDERPDNQNTDPGTEDCIMLNSLIRALSRYASAAYGAPRCRLGTQ
jgi:hypothetical protein